MSLSVLQISSFQQTVSPYHKWKNNIEKLDALAKECREDNISSKRFLYSEMLRENTKEQMDFLFGEVAKRRYNPEFERI